jgi:CRP-like cAMP-binding protein
MHLHRHDNESKALADELAGLELLSGLDRKSVEALAGVGRVVHLPAGWALMSEDTPADSCYVLLGGDTEVRHGSQVIAQLHPGALIGEAALVQHRRRNATVITAGEVRALRLSYDDLAPLFARHPGVEQVFRAEWDKRATPA